MRSHYLRAGTGSAGVEDLRTELQKVGDAIKNGRAGYAGTTNSTHNIQYDGNTMYISDGGGDMYDSGNATYILTENSPTSWTDENVNNQIQNCAPLQYSRTTVTDGSFNSTTSGSFPLQNYKFVAGGYGTTALPNGNSNYNTVGVLIMAATAGNYNSSSNMRIGFGHKGNAGADGQGSVHTDFTYENATVDGFTVYAYAISTRLAGDPTVCNLYMFLGHPNWGTTFGGWPVTYFETNTDKCNRGAWINGTQNNVLAITALLPPDNSVNAHNTRTTAMNQASVNAIISDIKTEFGY